MALTYQAIATTTVGSGGASSIDFTSIPQTYTDLYLVCSIRTLRANFVDYPRIKPNNSTTGISLRALRGSSGGAGSYTDTSLYFLATGNTATSNTFGNSAIYIPNYTSSNYKSFSVDAVSENNSTDSYTDLYAALWSNTSAITSLIIDNSYSGGGNFMQYSTATLYGIKNTV